MVKTLKYLHFSQFVPLTSTSSRRRRLVEASAGRAKSLAHEPEYHDLTFIIMLDGTLVTHPENPKTTHPELRTYWHYRAQTTDPTFRDKLKDIAHQIPGRVASDDKHSWIVVYHDADLLMGAEKEALTGGIARLVRNFGVPIGSLVVDYRDNVLGLVSDFV